MAQYALLPGISLYYLHLISLASCNISPADWRSKIHSSVLTVLDSQLTGANANWSSRSDIIEDENPFGMSTPSQRNGQLFPYNYWPNNGKCVPFKLHPAFDADTGTRQRILNAMRTIERRTQSCVTFKMWYNESEYIHVYPGKHCEADVGRIPGTRTRVRLGRECMQNGILLHELLHALGFFHEHNRPDRDHHLDVFPDHVESGKYDPNFIILRNMSNHGILYDFESIMHYSPLAFAHNANKPTLVPKVPLPVRMGQQEYLSVLDVAKLKRAYGCIDEHFEQVPQAASPVCTVDHHLNPSALTTALPATTTTMPAATSTGTILQLETTETGCSPPEAKRNATWLVRDADTLWSLNHTLVTATVRSIVDGVVTCQYQTLTATTNSFAEISILLPKKDGLQLAVTFEAAGYHPIILRNAQLDGNSDVITTFMEPLLFISRRFTGSGTVTGTVYSFSKHRTGLQGVRLDFRTDMNSHIETPVESRTTPADGTWSVTLAGGHYTVTASKSGFISVVFTVIVVGGKSRQDGVRGLSPVLDNGIIRIVSLGGDASRSYSLPVHVRGPIEGKPGRAHTNALNRAVPGGFVRYEFNTFEFQSALVTKQLAGIYRVSVSDYWLIHKLRNGTLWDMANFGATVQLFTGNKLWAQYFMPNRPGNAWSVVEIDGTHLKTINEVNTVHRNEDVN